MRVAVLAAALAERRVSVTPQGALVEEAAVYSSSDFGNPELGDGGDEDSVAAGFEKVAGGVNSASIYHIPTYAEFTQAKNGYVMSSHDIDALIERSAVAESEQLKSDAASYQAQLKANSGGDVAAHQAANLRKDAPTALSQAGDAPAENPQDFRAGIDPPPKPSAPYEIPYHLFLTSQFASLDDVPPEVKENVEHIIAMNPGIGVSWFDNDACESYLKGVSPNLHDVFVKTKHGPFKSDLCRTAWLAEHGGWYVDLDIDLRQPFYKLVPPTTAFTSAWDADNNALLNAFIGTKPNSLVLRNAVVYLEEHAQVGCMKGFDSCGTKALKDGFKKAFTNCGELVPTRYTSFKEQVACDEPVRMFVEVDLANPRQRSDASRTDAMVVERAIQGRGKVPNFRGASNKASHFRGLDYALIFEGSDAFVAGYSRFDKCTSWGCDQNSNPNDLATPIAVRAAPDGSLWPKEKYDAAATDGSLPADWPKKWAKLPKDVGGKLSEQYAADLQAAALLQKH